MSLDIRDYSAAEQHDLVEAAQFAIQASDLSQYIRLTSYRSSIPPEARSS